MFEGFTQAQLEGAGARINLRYAGSGPPLLLLHGNPLTHVMWHKIAPGLAQDFTVVATDLRGYGDSSKPDGGPDHGGYSFRAMGQDQAEVMAALGFRQYYVCGHDRGARVAHRMALDYPERVSKAAFLDIVPTHHLLNNIKKTWAVDSYHWFFMAQPYDYPEQMLIAYGLERYIRKKLDKKGVGMSGFTPEALAEYIRCCTPENIHAVCEDYRAGCRSISSTTRPICSASSRSRSWCYGASAATSTAAISRSRHGSKGRSMFGERCCPADIIRPSSRPMKRIRNCVPSLGEWLRRLNSTILPWQRM